MQDRFVKDLAATGVSDQEAARRYERAAALRRASTEKERVYWNGALKSGGGPDAPLQLLQETVRWMKPGRAERDLPRVVGVGCDWLRHGSGRVEGGAGGGGFGQGEDPDQGSAPRYVSVRRVAVGSDRVFLLLSRAG